MAADARQTGRGAPKIFFCFFAKKTIDKFGAACYYNQAVAK